MPRHKLVHRGFESGSGPEQSLPTQIGAKTNDHMPAPPLAPENKDRRSLKRKRRRTGGKDILIKNLASRDNAIPKRVKLQTGISSSALRRGGIDRRTTEGRLLAADVLALRAHVGGDPSIAQQKLIEDAARLGLIGSIAWQRLMDAGTILRGDGLHPALEAFLKSSRDRRDVLRLLGLNRHTRPIKLSDVLDGKQELPDAHS